MRKRRERGGKTPSNPGKGQTNTRNALGALPSARVLRPAACLARQRAINPHPKDHTYHFSTRLGAPRREQVSHTIHQKPKKRMAMGNGSRPSTPTHQWGGGASSKPATPSAAVTCGVVGPLPAPVSSWRIFFLWRFFPCSADRKEEQTRFPYEIQEARGRTPRRQVRHDVHDAHARNRQPT